MKSSYLAFVYYQYYPLGGWNDLVGVFDTERDAVKAANKAVEKDFDGRKIYWHVVESSRRKIVAEGKREE